MALRTERAGHVPAAPSLLDRRGVIWGRGSQAGKKQGIAIGIWKYGLREQATRSAQPMAARALCVAMQEPRLPPGSGLQRIKDDAPRRVESCQLDVAVLGKSDKDVVVEIHGARYFGTDKVGMKAGFGENQHLRIDVHIETREQIRQEPLAFFLVVEFHFPALDALLKKGARILAG